MKNGIIARRNMEKGVTNKDLECSTEIAYSILEWQKNRDLSRNERKNRTRKPNPI